jgi:hypothetical protein
MIALSMADEPSSVDTGSPVRVFRYEVSLLRLCSRPLQAPPVAAATQLSAGSTLLDNVHSGSFLTTSTGAAVGSVGATRIVGEGRILTCHRCYEIFFSPSTTM